MAPIVGADTAKGLVTAELQLPAPPEAVFAALTDPEQLRVWWGSPDAYRTLDWQLDLRPCGTWSATMEDAQGRQQTVHGQFMVVDPPRLLVQSWQPSWDSGAPTVIRYELAIVGQGTRLRVSHGGFVGRAQSCEEHARDWQRVLQWLDAYLGAHQAAVPT